MSKKILVLGAGIMQIPIIKKIRAMGYIPVVVDYAQDAPGFKYSSNNHVVSTMDYEGVLGVAKREKVNGVLTTSDAPVRVVSKVAKVLGLNAMSEGTADICTNKLKQRLLFKENSIGCPVFDIVDSEFRGPCFLSFPCIVKPVDSSASRGVTIARNPDELRKSIHYAFEYSRSDKVLVEQFVEGREFSVETFSQDNKTTVIAINEKHLLDNGYFVENTHIEPADLTKQEVELISKEVKRAISAVGLDNSPSHTEVKLCSGKVYIIEMACRLGGDYITSDLVPLSTGVDMLENLIKVSIGEKIDVIQKKHRYAAVQFINNYNYETCKRYIEENKAGNIVRYEIKPFVDKPIKNSLDRLGYIIIEGESRECINIELSKMNGYGQPYISSCRDVC